MTKLLLSAVGLLILILDSKTAIQGAAEGVRQCIKTVIPALFPTMVLSMMITGNALGRTTSFIQKLCKPFGVPVGNESLLFVGLVGGYPTGAKCVVQAYRNGSFDFNAYSRLLGFCSNAGPAFMFGMAAPFFKSKADLWALWLIHIISALSTAIILPQNNSSGKGTSIHSAQTLANVLPEAVKVMGITCGWIIAFKVLVSFCDRWFLWILPETLRCMIYGLTELTNGILSLGSIPDDSLRFFVCSAMMAFGGLCVLMQTCSITADSGLGYYLPGKLLQTCFSVIYSSLWNRIFRNSFNIIIFITTIAVISFIIYILNRKKAKITVDFLTIFDYNVTRTNEAR